MTSPQLTHTQWCSSKIRNKTRMPTLITFIQHSIGSPRHNQTRERNKRNPNWKEDVKLSLSSDDMILYIENPKDSTKKPLDLINEFGKDGQYNINTQESIAILYTNNKLSERVIKKTIHLQLHQKE